jgi:preprotein translocase subunit SecB
MRLEKFSLNNYNNVGDFKLIPLYNKQINKIKENEYEVKIELRINNTKTNPFPMDLELLFAGHFIFDLIDDVSELDKFLNIGALQILFPYVRTIVSTITGASLMMPLILPIIDVRNIPKK